MTPSREIFYNVALPTTLVMYAAVAIPVAFLALGLARRAAMWRKGAHADRFDHPGARLWDALLKTVLHGRVVRRRNLYAGLMHLCLFWGFMVLLAGTTLVFIEVDIATPFFDVRFLKGNAYLAFKLAMNLGGLLLIAGVAMAMYRRLVLRPSNLETSGDDLLILAFLLALAVQGFALQGLRLAMTQDPWAAWSFVSYPVSLALQGMEPAQLALLHRLNWHAHFLTAFLFFGYVAFSKMIHPFTAVASVLLRRRRPRGELARVEGIETAESIGVSRLQDFNWVQLLSLDACLHCGRCLEYCPTTNTGKALRPRDFVLELAGLQADQGGMFSGVLGEGANSGRVRHGAGAQRDLIGGAVSEQEIWDCTTCGSCMEQCPVSIEHVPMIVDLRRNLVMEKNSFPQELGPVFTSIERLGNPFQAVPMERDAWTAKLEQPIPRMAEVAASGATVDYLFFVGCQGSYSPRHQKTTIALARILQAAQVDFAILGKEEACHGDPAKRMGHEYLAQQQSSAVVDKLNAYGVRKVVTACPHCFNAMRNEFPQIGGHFEVVHHSQLIAELLAAGRVSLATASPLAHEKITYHDPCYLGRHNGIYAAPRDAVEAVAGRAVQEMPRNRQQSFCCGGGGGRAFMKEQTGSRINLERVREAMKTGSDVIAAACPFCMDMLEDGIGGLDATSSVRVLDVAELVAASMEVARP